MPIIPLRISIPDSEISFSYVRSSGPGGQNVNKVNSKALLRWNLAGSSLSADVKERLTQRLANHLTKEGEILVSSDRFRDQGRNREDCFEKFQQLVSSALAVQKSRRKTKASYSTVKRGQEAKRLHSQKKKQRSFSRED